MLPEVTLCSPQTLNVTKLYEDGLGLEIINYMSSPLETVPTNSSIDPEQFTVETLESKRKEIFQHAEYGNNLI